MIDWENRKIGQVCKVISGYAFKSSEFQETGIPVLKIANIRNGNVEFNDINTQFLDSNYLQSISERYIVEKGDILVSLTGSHITQPNSVVGRVAKYNFDYPSLLNQRAAKLLVQEDVDSDFIFYYLASSRMRELIALRAQGAASQANISPKDIESIRIDLPPLQIQQKIASILSTYDELIENNNKRIAILENMAEEIYKEWFVRLRFPGYEEVEVVDGVPEGWENKKLGDEIELLYGKSLTEEKRDPGKIPVYGSGGIGGYHSKSLVKGPGIIIGRKGTVGSVYLEHRDFFPIDTVYYVKSSLPMNFVFRYLKSQSFLSGDSAVPGLNRNQAYGMQLTCPDQSLLKKFDDLVEPMTQQTELLRKKNEVLQKTRDLLLPRLISGKLSVEHLLEESKGELSVAAEPETKYETQ
jgi:type I restriction enzyme S subunit